METKKTRQKTINIARKYPFDSTTMRWSQSKESAINIFKSSLLQTSLLNENNKPFECVGFKQLKQYISKKKKTVLSSKKRGWCGTPSCSIKTYSAVKSSQQQDLLMTKEDILNYYNEEKKTDHEYENCYEQTLPTLTTSPTYIQSPLLVKKTERLKNDGKDKKIDSINVRLTYSQDKYLQNLENLKRNELRQKKQNIPCSYWIKTLRNSFEMRNIYDKSQQNFEVIKKNGFKLVAESKRKKEKNWMQSQRDSALFMPIQQNKSPKMLESRIGRQTDQTTNF